MESNIRKRIEEYVKSLKWTPKDFYWKHTLQVRKYAFLIQENVGGDKDVIEISTLLHDIGKVKLLAPGHEEISTKLAKEFLEKIGFDKNKIQRIIECIKYEDFSSIESRILRSADNMSLIMDNSGGKEWFFNKILKGDNKKIILELNKSYSEIEFDFAKKLVENTYKKLLKRYESKVSI